MLLWVGGHEPQALKMLPLLFSQKKKHTQQENNGFCSHRRKTLHFLPSESSRDGRRSDETLGCWTQTLAQLRNLS